MKPFLRLSAAAAALCAAGSAAWSMTAEEAWEAWVSLAAGYGETVSAASTGKAGGVLTAEGVTVAFAAEEMSLNGTLGDVTFTENGDGSVSIAMPPEFDLSLVVDPEFGEKVEAVIGFEMQGLEMKASDAGGATTFTYEAPAIAIALEEMTVDGKPLELALTGTINGSSGNYSAGSGDPAQITSLFNAESFEIVFDGRDPEGTGQGKGRISVAGISSTSAGQGQMLFLSPENLPELLKAGAAVQGSTVVGETTFEVETQEGPSSFAMNGTMEGGNATVSLDASQVTYAITYEGLDVTASGSDIPLPEVSFGLGETTLSMIMPIARSEEPAPFMLAVGLKELSLADGLWNLFDPGSVLPRDPATLTFNLTGQGNWLIDILDPETMANPQGMPGQLHALTVSDVVLSVAGAEFTANGAFTFDNDDLTTWGGMPAPNGSLTARLTGGNGLLDNLVTMGLLPAEQANGFKLGAGAFARPGDGPDTLVSEIVVTPDGTVSANGIPIPVR